MKRFAALLETLILTPSRNRKIATLGDYFAAVPDPDRGLAVAAITRDLTLRHVKPALLRGLTESRVLGLEFKFEHLRGRSQSSWRYPKGCQTMPAARSAHRRSSQHRPMTRSGQRIACLVRQPTRTEPGTHPSSRHHSISLGARVLCWYVRQLR